MTLDNLASLTNLRKAGFFIIAWTPEEMEAMDEAASERMEDYLITKGNEFIADNETSDELPACPSCNGCGEGQYDGTSCGTCGGAGVIKPEKEYDPPEP